MTEAAIIGGGIAGTAMALALHKLGMPTRIYESYPRETVETGGALMTLWPNGMHALDQLGVRDRIEAASPELHTVRAFGADGAQRAELPMGQRHPPLPGFRYLLRGTLNRTLHDAVLDLGIPVLHDRELASVERAAGKPRLRFTDGARVDTELLIGADGAHSRVRRFVDERAPAARYTGERVVYGTSSEPSACHELSMYSGPRTTFGHAGIPDGGSWWFCRVRDKCGERPALTEGLENYVLAALTEHAGDLGRFVRASTVIAANNTWDMHDLPNWHAGGDTMLVGDAAHATSPAAAQGASLAVEDAVMFAKCLRDLPADAFPGYERLRRARANRIVQGGSVGASRDPDRQRRDPADKQHWLYEYPLDWKIPVTKALAEQVAASQQ
ncbi:FAD-dependent oxidoreductase [Sciscionella sediminilitoris]|uniref:FAD-dependent oxidoreductase n=1 Tax=Sciscionella sediminilitoris TaxID=1445613 RepID=UPI0006923D17|nr:NAD(P)/FAD-dependent oxidoreductase [Sciscionella sp. SE31]